MNPAVSSEIKVAIMRSPRGSCDHLIISKRFSYLKDKTLNINSQGEGAKKARID